MKEKKEINREVFVTSGRKGGLASAAKLTPERIAQLKAQGSEALKRYWENKKITDKPLDNNN